MTTITEFLQANQGTTPEARLAHAYRQGVCESERLTSELLKHLVPIKSPKGFLAGFDHDAEPFVAAIESMHHNIKTIAVDIEHFVELAGDVTVDRLIKDKNRYQKALNDAANNTKATTLRAIRRGAASVAEAELSDDVQNACAKADRVSAEYEPRLADVARRLSEARAILNKY